LCLNGIDSAKEFRKGRQKPRFDAKALLCYWAARELKIPLTDLARKLEMTISGIGYAAQRGKPFAIIFICLNELFSYLWMSRSPINFNLIAIAAKKLPFSS
jgi:hypothetical protein